MGVREVVGVSSGGRPGPVFTAAGGFTFGGPVGGFDGALLSAMARACLRAEAGSGRG